MRVLSTKKLSEKQKSQVEGFTIDEIPMIRITYGDDFALEENIINAVFTSANSVRAVFENRPENCKWFHTVFCVGKKTKQLLEGYGLTVEVIANNALELAEVLAQRFSEQDEGIKEISWFCGNLRNNDLPIIMAENGVLVTEYLVYKTEFIPKALEVDYDAVLFFSPSGIKSYLKKNQANSNPVVCIGNTTASEAIVFFDNVYMAEETTVESVLDKVKEILV